jgi:Tol biopolymer transport system component/C-terminal processing protease CtpA/Prc
MIRLPRRTAPLIALLLAAAARGAAPSVLQQPSLSPDGHEIAFVTAGGIWTVPAVGGDASPLVANLSEVLRPLYSPDGKRLAFVSTKSGSANVYVLSFDTGDLKRLTFDDAPDRLDAWSRDGKSLYFSTGGHEVGGTPDVYRVDADGGTPMPVVAGPFESDFYAAPAPDGHTVAFCGKCGMVAGQWWRHGHAHIDCGALWTTDGAPKPTYTQLTDEASKHLWPMWSPDGRTLYFMSDGDGAENLYAQPFATGTTRPTPTQLTHFHDGRLLWPSLSADGRSIVFERDFGVWKLDVASGAVGPVTVRLRGIVTASAPQRQSFGHDASDLAVSHDGKKVAVVVHGQVFAGPTVAGDHAQPAFRVTHTDAIESDVAWSHDDRKVVYISTRDGSRHVYLYDFTSKAETRLTDSPANDSDPAFSPDDATVAYVRDGKQLRAVDLNAPARRRRFATTRGSTTRPATLALATRATATTRPLRDRLLADGLMLPQPPWGGRGTIAWAPAGDYVAIVSTGAKGFRNIYLIPSTGGVPRQASFVANAESTDAAWAPDGSMLLFGSSQRTEDAELERVDLKPRTPTFRTDQFSDLFKQRPNRTTPEPTTPHQPSGEDEDGAATTKTTSPATTTVATTAPTTGPATRPEHTEIVWDGIEQRLGLLPVGVDVGAVAVSPDGKWAGVIGESGGRENVYLYPLDPLVENPVAKQMTATATGKGDLQFAADPGGGGTRLYFREGGAIRYVPVPARTSGGNGSTDSTGDVALTAEMEVSFDRDKRIAFDQAWRYLADHFHDPAMHGLDWAAVRRRFAPQLEATKTPADERRVLSLMIGELNASHMGITGGNEDAHTPVAHLGLSWDPAEYARTGKLRVSDVLPFGPAALAGIKVGQFVSAIDAATTDRPANVDQLLENKADKEVTLVVADDGTGAGQRDVKVMTASAGTERTLAYKAWVQANRDYVARASHNRLGYVHLAAMGKPDMARLYADLDARNATYDGVVVDVRNNNGGFVNGYAIDVFTRKSYITIQDRGGRPVPGRVALGQRYLGLPTVLVTNRDTLSDGEDFAEGYQALGLGDTVGEPTAGWIIFTSGTTLLDGTGLRLPSETVRDHNGQEMEMHPRPVDTFVERPVGEASLGKDSQLDAAVKDLLAKLK